MQDFLSALTKYKPLTDLLIALTPVTVAAIVAFIGWLQWKTSDDKFRFDLYQRRLNVYMTAVKFYIGLIGSRLDSQGFDDKKKEFHQAKLESQFLFDTSSGIYLLLEELQYRSMQIIFGKTDPFIRQLGPMIITEQLEELSKNLEWMNKEAMPSLARKMSPYLSFRDSWFSRFRQRNDRKYAEQLASEMNAMINRLKVP